ncbi:hypothetical protein GGR56DRAFT_686235 [Xylariaceae sp. FL0804]|nr:hypothetical protein GGR56DRAFT_686235 [Xylariaceae sp. FL0804]
MAPLRSRAARAVSAAPFLLLSAWYLLTMDLPKVVEHQQPFAQAGVIEWEGGRGRQPPFPPSTRGFDPVASWQMFSFLTDVDPLYAIWPLDPSIFSVAAQFSGIGIVAPLFYFACLVVGPSSWYWREMVFIR